MDSICGIVNLEGRAVDRPLVERMLEALPRGESFVFTDRRGSALFARHTPGGGVQERDLSPGSPAPPPSSFLTIASARFAGAPGESLEERARRHGEAWPRHIQGAFAAAVWNEETRELRLARDPLGERHLCWAQLATLVLFASEPAQLLAAGVPNQPDRSRILAHLLASAPSAVATFFERIERVPPGHQVLVSPAGARRSSFWSWKSFPGEKVSAADAPGELIGRLDDAVGRRLPSAGETGLLLSGGLDSISLALAADRLLAAGGRRLQALTWTSRSGDGIDETARSRKLLASRSRIREHPVEADGVSRLSRYPEAYADPNGPEANAFPDLLLATLETARGAGVSVLLNGLGGDSAVGWLAPPLSSLLRCHLRSIPRSAGESIARAIARQLLLATRRRPLPDWLAADGRRLAKAHELDKPPLSWREAATRDGFRRFALSHFENASTLERLERWSRRWGIEIVAPWYDLKIASLILGLPDRALADHPPTKVLVRRALLGSLPAELLEPTEKAVSSSLTEGLRPAEVSLAQDLLRGSRLAALGLIEIKSLLRIFNNELPSTPIPPLFWRVLTTEAWLRNKVNL